LSCYFLFFFLLMFNTITVLRKDKNILDFNLTTFTQYVMNVRFAL